VSRFRICFPKDLLGLEGRRNGKLPRQIYRDLGR
jgi:hypothetical protein